MCEIYFTIISLKKSGTKLFFEKKLQNDEREFEQVKTFNLSIRNDLRRSNYSIYITC